MDLSVLIATYNRKDDLKRIVEILENQTMSQDQYEIIITDSFSIDGTKELVQGLQQDYNNIVYIEDCKNILANKRNVGIKASRGQTVIFLDDDVYPYKEDFLEQHYKANINNRDTFFCGQIRFDPKLVQESNYYRFRDDQHLKDDSVGKELEFNKIVVMNLSFRKEFIDKVGYVDERFINYGCEDIEFGFRIKRKGFHIKYLREAKAIHREKSNSIVEYSKKIIKSKIYGQQTLYTVCPEIKKYLFQSKFDNKCILNILLFNKFSLKLTEVYLLFTDTIKICYNYLLYKFYLYCVSYLA